jgi:translation elongation factor EF-1beta
VKKHRLTPSDFSFRSKEEQPVAFQLLVIAAMVYVANDKMGYWHDKNMLRSLSEEGRQGLLRS